MHIPDGLLPLPVTLAGIGAASSAAWYSLHKIKQRKDPREDIPKASLLTAAFFTASLVHIPVPPASAHLMLNGLLGALLGWFAFPAILLGLFFQAVMFGHGGFLTLGINAVIIGCPAIAGYHLFRLRGRGAPGPGKTVLCAFIAGFVTVLLSIILFAVVVIGNISPHMSAEAEETALVALMLAHTPVAVIEGAVTALAVSFLHRVKPGLLEGI